MSGLHTKALLICALAVLCAGCAGNGGALAARECPAPQLDSPEYRIGPGDMLQVFVWRNPELSATVPVRPDGRISTPLVEDMVAAGKTPSQLARDMESVLAEYLRTPTVNVIVDSQGQANQIQIVGQVLAPQAVSYRQGIRVLDVLVAAGGLGEFAAGNRARVARTIDGRSVECSVRLADVLAGDIADNILLFPGDVVVVPQTRF